MVHVLVALAPAETHGEERSQQQNRQKLEMTDTSINSRMDGETVVRSRGGILYSGEVAHQQRAKVGMNLRTVLNRNKSQKSQQIVRYFTTFKIKQN